MEGGGRGSQKTNIQGEFPKKGAGGLKRGGGWGVGGWGKRGGGVLGGGGG